MSEFDRAPREYRSPPASDLRKQVSAREREQLGEMRQIYQRRFGKWTRTEPSGPLYPELPPFLWGVASGLVLAVPIVGLVGVLT